MAPTSTALATHDTRSGGVVHLPERDPYPYRGLTPRPVEDLDECVAQLNAETTTEQ